MPDSKIKQDGRDRSKVDANDPNEVEFLHRQFPDMAHQEIVAAIKNEGPNRKNIVEFLESKKKRK